MSTEVGFGADEDDVAVAPSSLLTDTPAAAQPWAEAALHRLGLADWSFRIDSERSKAMEMAR